MESLIRKQQKKKRMANANNTQSDTNPFEEVERYFKHPRLRRQDCPNPIPWWGVSTIALIFFDCIDTNYTSFNSNIRLSALWREIILPYRQPPVSLNGLSHCQRALMIPDADR
jgi:hypothetical protein